jgi:hypothetical protein
MFFIALMLKNTENKKYDSMTESQAGNQKDKE